MHVLLLIIYCTSVQALVHCMAIWKHLILNTTSFCSLSKRDFECHDVAGGTRDSLLLLFLDLSFPFVGMSPFRLEDLEDHRSQARYLCS